jgi:small subunit ribosomal protein S16
MDSRSPRDGKAIEELGHYDPMIRDKAKRVSLNLERIAYWISVGAQPSEKVAALIKKVQNNRFGTAAEPPPILPPKERTAPAAPEGADAAATADDGSADESTSDNSVEPAKT